MKSPLPYGRQSIEDADIEAVIAALRSDWITQGPRVERFEEALAEFCGADYAVAVSSGTAALHIAALALGLQPGDVGVTSDVTFVASANCIRYGGAEVQLIDVDPDTGLLRSDMLERVVTDLAASGRPPKLIVPVDFAGSTPDLVRARHVADTVGAFVIEDAAHSLGATYLSDGVANKTGSCSHSDAAILSFHPVKHITTGEGGAVLCNDEGLATTLRELRSHGITRDLARLHNPEEGPWWYEQQRLGFNYRLTDLQCALGLSQLQRFPAALRRRRELAQRYREELAKAGLESFLSVLSVPDGVNSAYHLFVVRVRPQADETLASLSVRRKALFLHLRAHDIFAQVHYIPVHRQPDYRTPQTDGALDSSRFPGADGYYAGCLSLPMFSALQDADVVRVVAALADFFLGKTDC